MPSFSLTPLDPFPPAAGPFPGGTQFQDEQVNVGPPEPKYVNFTGPGVQATYDNSAGRVNVFVSQTGGTQFQDEGVNRGGPAPSFVNFTGNGVTATYTPSSDTVVVNIPGSSGGGGGKPVVYARRLQSTQTSGNILIYDTVSSYEPTLGQYNTTNGIFTANTDGFFLFNASVVIYREYTLSSQQMWYVGIISPLPNNIEIVYAFSQFNDLFTVDAGQALRSSVSAGIQMTAGQHAYVAILKKSIGDDVDKQYLSTNFYFDKGTPPLGSQAWARPTFSVIYYPLPPGEW
jgi:hypothetical protein